MSVAKSRLRWAALLICAGLIVFLATLFSVHPLYFIAYAMIGCPLVLLGMFFYVAALWADRKEKLEPESPSRRAV